MFLITRDIENALETEKFLKLYGFPTLIEPLINLEILSFDIKNILDNFQNENKMTLLIFTSKNALKSLFLSPVDSKRKKFIDQLFFTGLCKIIVVGESVRDFLLCKFNNNINIDQNIKTCINVNELYNIIISDFDKKCNIIYFSGEDIKRNINLELSKQGYTVKRIITYKMNASESFSMSIIDKFKKHEIKYVLLYSVRTAKIFLDLIKKSDLYEELDNLIFFVLSESIANIIGSKKVIFPTVTDSDSLIECIVSYFNKFNFNNI